MSSEKFGRPFRRSHDLPLQPASAGCTIRPMKPTMLLFAIFLLGFPACSAAQAPGATPNPAVAPSAMKSWLIRIIPPRPTFDKDATSDEQALMDRHFDYWKNLNQQGVCIFGGPVLDPKGVYGILVVRATSEDIARALGDADPSVKAGMNKIEVAEMHVAFVPAHHS